MYIPLIYYREYGIIYAIKFTENTVKVLENHYNIKMEVE